jgi:hypothetical protein
MNIFLKLILLLNKDMKYFCKLSDTFIVILYTLHNKQSIN